MLKKPHRDPAQVCSQTCPEDTKCYVISSSWLRVTNKGTLHAGIGAFQSSRSRLQTWDLCHWKVWQPFCSASVARVNTQDGEGCYFNLHAIATRFGWLTQNAPDTYLNGKCSIFVRQTILWKLVFCHSPEQCEVRKMACVSCLCYKIPAFSLHLSFLSTFFSRELTKAKRMLFTIFFRTIQHEKYNLLLCLNYCLQKLWVFSCHDFCILLRWLGRNLKGFKNHFENFFFLFFSWNIDILTKVILCPRPNIMVLFAADIYF